MSDAESPPRCPTCGGLTCSPIDPRAAAKWLLQGDDERLPAVAGDALTVPLEQFERSARVLLREEQSKFAADNALLGVLCNAVRLAREHAGLLGEGIPEAEHAYPEVTGQMILDAGFNVFAFQLILKDLARKKDEHARLEFGYQGARWLIEVDRRP